MGGTGGHIIPALAARETFIHEDIEVLLLGKGLAHFLGDDSEVAYCDIPSGSPFSLRVNRMFSGAKQLYKGYVAALQKIRDFTPDLAIGFGSYHSLPAMLASIRSRIPLFLHEQNIVPGKVNKLFSRFAKGVGMSFAAAGEHFHCRAEEVFLPIRKLSEQIVFPGASPVICVVGGSQGAKILNDVVPKALARIRESYSNLYVHHIVGPKGDLQAVSQVYQDAGINHTVTAFDHNMLGVLQASDLVISRSGATMLNELLWVQVPAILVPYPGAYGHQEVNAKFFTHTVGGGTMILQKYLTEESLSKQVLLALDPATSENRRKAMLSAQQKKSFKSLYQFICESL
ncbi:UDP-N-acetylglucosamine-N-acetylmuramyl-(pentapeptide) pyrophosphoryl-undecaprenol N-acetylglucosamine transferase [Chlamydia trachomatis]|nr:undecaprenyldiphospho-muramoylpentapeptide beta-N-acetylglucosaminyltransferase [Chlamydia trachomatis]CCP50940.1 undecaprenyldiphospho-muramoylpentapeptide beta-N-acetylglucosaminyltransferase [Chlamydia trachomatis K/SotonK1]CRH45327.1 UDP-N-acetylglucosamine-N-acetylmuramyl-(pentapeptide) pyrophosphoryl-undecaprenol N-acetylglucosamine transferase [Chlamydia trachomatis]CRH46909.1 UDP-N-acetylglucosamine-N-acetylmuramyl-(pentapeptide) pyrophosphoryl-undecaprenol N-acetylglucosamine transfe